MRDLILFLTLFFTIISYSFSQTYFHGRIVDTDVEGIVSVYAYDMDNDGDKDIVGASYDENK